MGQCRPIVAEYSPKLTGKRIKHKREQLRDGPQYREHVLGAVALVLTAKQVQNFAISIAHAGRVSSWPRHEVTTSQPGPVLRFGQILQFGEH